MLALVVIAFAAFLQSQTPGVDVARDRVLHGRIQEFFDGKLTAQQLEASLRVYARQFEARPYKVGAAPIEWLKIPEEKLLTFSELISRISAPAQQAFFKGELTAAQAAGKIAPWFLIWNRYGLDPPPEPDPLWQRRKDELMLKIGEFAAP